MFQCGRTVLLETERITLRPTHIFIILIWGKQDKSITLWDKNKNIGHGEEREAKTNLFSWNYYV